MISSESLLSNSIDQKLQNCGQKGPKELLNRCKPLFWPKQRLDEMALSSIGLPFLLPAGETGGCDDTFAQSGPRARRRKIASAASAKAPLQMERDPDPVAGADLACYLHISVAPSRMQLMLLGGKKKEPFHPLSCQVPDLPCVFSVSHCQPLFSSGIKSIST
jgi:hypothetical protein